MTVQERTAIYKYFYKSKNAIVFHSLHIQKSTNSKKKMAQSGTACGFGANSPGLSLGQSTFFS